MSAEQLKLIDKIDGDYELIMMVDSEDELLTIQIRNEIHNQKTVNAIINLDRNQANLLMLYLQEHLK